MAKRFERIKRRRIRLTERDFKIVEAVFEARYMTNKMIARLFFKPTTFSWCKQRIRYLFDLGYLKKRKAYINEPDIYFLGLKGRRYIASLGEYPQEMVDKIAGVSGGSAAAPFLMMRHDLTLSSLYVNARLETRRYGFSMRWKNARMLELMKLGLQPDAFIAVGKGDKERAAFIEFTAVVPTKREMRRKIIGYEQYLESERCRQDLGVESVAVLWLTDSPSKVSRLAEAIWQSVYRDYFLIGLIDEATNFITSPIWKWSESDEKVSWISPPGQVIYENSKGGEIWRES